MPVLVDLGARPMGSAVSLVVAQNPQPANQGDEFGKASPVGLVVILLLGIATIFLIRSMTKHLRKVPASFDRSEPSQDGAPAGDATADGGGSRATEADRSDQDVDRDVDRDVEVPPDR